MSRVPHSRRFALAAAALALCVPTLARVADATDEKEIILAAGEEAPKDHVRPSVFLAVDRLPAGGDARFAVVLDVESGWHINANPPQPSFAEPTAVTVKAKHGTKAAKVEYPKGSDLVIEGLDEPFSVYEGKVVLFGTLAVPDKAARQTEELTVEVKFQACDDKQCLRPKTLKLTGKVLVAAPGEPVKPVNEKLFEKDKTRRDET